MKHVPPLPRMRKRPIYVQYVALRKCRRNPSWESFIDLPEEDRQRLWSRWELNHQKKRPE